MRILLACGLGLLAWPSMANGQTNETVESAAYPTESAAYPTESAAYPTESAAYPIGNPGTWITNADYPTLSIRLREEGTTRFRLTIGTNGRVKDCEITESSGSRLLDEQTCAALTVRGRFRPAMDADGNAVDSHYSNSVLWQIPDGAPLAPTSVSERGLEFFVDYDAEGKVENCAVVSVRPASEVTPDIRAAVCAEFEAPYYRIQPVENAQGEPVSARITYRSSVDIEERELSPID